MMYSDLTIIRLTYTTLVGFDMEDATNEMQMPSNIDDDRKKLVKRVFVGDTIVCLDGTEYVLVRDNNGSAWFKKKEK